MYSCVGHGGASGYLAVLSFSSLPAETIASTSLLLNVLTAGISLFFYCRAKCWSGALSLPLTAGSVPAAFVASTIRLDEHLYFLLLAVALFISAIKLFGDSITMPTDEEQFVKAPSAPVLIGTGAVLGAFSGLVGIGGGVFLSPLIILRRWADTKTTSAASALFIVVNSIAGISGRVLTGHFTTGDVMPLVAMALIGALVGSYLGATRFSKRHLRRILSLVLILAVVKLVTKSFS